MSRLLAAGASSVIGLRSIVDPDSPADVQPEANVQPDGVTDWTLTVSEEFNNNPTILNSYALRFHQGGIAWSTRYPDWLTAPDTGGGSVYTGNPGIPEQQYYGREGVSTADGALQLTATRLPVADILNPHPGFRYVSGQINSWPSHNPTYGFFEARMKLPGGLCQWPAFWMFPQVADPDVYREVDIMECFGSDTQTTVKNHLAGATVSLTITGVSGVVTEWHTFGMAWTPTQLVFYTDGINTETEDNLAAVPQVPMFPILNLACTPQADEADYPERMVTEVDYIRIWEANA